MTTTAAESILSGLNPEQRAATTHVEGPLLVLAGAGSGKTRVITHRIAYMLHLGIQPHNILAMSFTNKAAGEMRERAAGMVGKKMAARLNLSTFHSMGADLLRKYIHRLGFRSRFTILDQGDQIRVVKDVLEELEFKRDKLDPKKIHAIISRAKNAFKEPNEMGGAMRFNPLLPYAQKVYTRYVEACQAFNAVDFDDLITLPVKLLMEHEDVLEKVRDKYRYIMVDEYQDTNDTQLKLLGLICQPRVNLCAVGDDDQSIYAFRGAVSKHILDFDKQFPGARVVKLEQNYRSTSIILRSANAVIANNRTRRDKTLWSALGDGEKLKYFELDNEEEEANFVAADISRRKETLMKRWHNFAILMRTAILSRPLEEALRAMNVPYKLIGGKSFFDRREVKDLVAYMRAMINPDDEVSLRRIINTPRRGAGPTAMSRISRWAADQRLPMHKALRRVDEIKGVGPMLRTNIGGLMEMLDEFGQRFEVEPPHEVLAALIARLRYEDYIMDSEKSEKVARIRLKNIKELVASMSAFHDRGAPGGLEGYLTRLTLDSSSQDKEEEDGDEVILMTLHASKGLEFPDVYMVGFEEEILPHARSMEAGADGDIEEERRLTYVGITRAKRSLVLTSARKRGRGQAARKRKPSRFLHEIPKDLLINMGSNPHLLTEATKNARKVNLAKLRAVIFDD